MHIIRSVPLVYGRLGAKEPIELSWKIAATSSDDHCDHDRETQAHQHKLTKWPIYAFEYEWE